VRAAVFERFETMTVRELADPEPTPGEALLRVRFCGICGSDLSLFKTGIMSGPDVVLGHEIAATVEAPVSGWNEGERVVPLPLRGCGECEWCRRGRPRYCQRPLDRYGGYAELVTFPAENLVAIPEGLDDRTAALAEPMGVAIRGARLAEVGAEDVVYVSGLGSIGLLTVAASAEAGARVVGGDPREDRRALGLELGCEDAFDPTAEDPFWRMFAYDPLGPRVAMECSGVPAAVQLALNTARHGGVVGLLGIPFEPTPIIPAVMAVKELRAFSISGPDRQDIASGLDLLSRRPEIARVATSIVSLEQTGEAMRRLAHGEGHDVKVLVAPAS
jgi:(R,R)-butanediol dehydrogenase / meso-butanediol dehydrogenase / diacetyl reductase